MPGARASAANYTPDEHLLRDSPLLTAGGFVRLTDWPGAAACAQLLREALEREAGAQEVWAPHSREVDARGGSPRRRYRLANGGGLQEALCHSAELLERLSQLAAAPVRPTGEAGSYSFFCRAGDHLSLHRDVPGCDLVTITLLADDGAGGGRHVFYPERLHEPVSALAAAPLRGARAIDLAPAETLVLLGGLVPHAVLPVVAGQRRIVSVVCFRIQCEGVGASR